MDTKFDMDVNEAKTGEPLRAIDSTADNVNAISDEDRLAQLGHAQELKRQFSLPTLWALCLCLMATWEALSTVVAQALLSGGAPCLFYNYVLSFVCSVCIAASLGEIASIYPTAGGVIHVVAFVAILIVLGVMAPKNTSSFVFTEFVNSSGWTNDGVSWLVGLISAVYPFLGYDAACHMAEEIPNATRNVPIAMVAMVGSVVANGLMGLVYVVVLLFSTRSLETLLATPTWFPFMQIYLDATKSRAGATVMSLTLITVAIAATVGCITSASRTLWAFARDKAVPFDAYFSHVHKDLQIPVRAIAVVTIMQLLLGFLYLGNTTAFNAVLSMAIIGIYLSYSIPIAYMLLVGRNRLTRKEYGPFRLGGFLGPVLNVVSLVWMTVVIIFSTFPSAQPVMTQNMNYSTVVMAGWLVSGLCYYFARGHAKFEVPVVISKVVEGVRT
ncbi:Choline transport protein [Colletotrichum viniferum]|nr:Choline transport protein [Colletotrichum viniferum]